MGNVPSTVNCDPAFPADNPIGNYFIGDNSFPFGRQFTAQCGSDTTGPVLSVSHDNFYDCIQNCGNNNDCQALSWVGDTCYLKSAPGDLVASDHGVHSFVSYDYTPPLSCPSADGQQYNGFIVQCGADYPGVGDMGGSAQPSLEDCAAKCSSTDGCVAAVYSGNACYLKNKISASSVPNSGVTLLCKADATPTPDDTNTDGPDASGLSCPNSDGKAVGDFTIRCGQDYFGGDLTSVYDVTFSDCIAACDANSQCVDVSFNHGACYLKSQLTYMQPNNDVWTAVKTAKEGQQDPADAVSCPKDGGKQYSANAFTYTISCDSDYPGGDLSSTHADTFAECIAACDSNEQCVDVVYNHGACYLKSTLTALVGNPGNWAALKGDAVVTPQDKPVADPTPETNDEDKPPVPQADPETDDDAVPVTDESETPVPKTEDEEEPPVADPVPVAEDDNAGPETNPASEGVSDNTATDPKESHGDNTTPAADPLPETDSDNTTPASNPAPESDGDSTTPASDPAPESEGDNTSPNTNPAPATEGDNTTPDANPSLENEGEQTAPVADPVAESDGDNTATDTNPAPKSEEDNTTPATNPAPIADPVPEAEEANENETTGTDIAPATEEDNKTPSAEPEPTAEEEDNTPAPVSNPATEANEDPAPVTDEKETSAPATDPAPATAVDESTTESPATENPATESPATENPATENPATENPATENPATENPATENPAVDTPAADDQPAVNPEPTADTEPAADESETSPSPETAPETAPETNTDPAVDPSEPAADPAPAVDDTKSESDQSTADSSTLDLSCPSDVGTTYTHSGITFQVDCGVDYVANDLLSANVDTLQGCVDLCAATPDCVALSYLGVGCYLKNAVQGPNSNGGVKGARVVGARERKRGVGRR